MKHTKTIGGLMMLVSLALVGCSVPSNSTPSTPSTTSDISVVSETPVSGNSGSLSLPSDTSISTSEISEPESGYAIREAGDFDLIRQFPDGEFSLMNDIDMSDVNFVPIPTFSGTFHGRNNTITGLTISESEHYHAGLFALIAGATISDLTFVDPDISPLVPSNFDNTRFMSVGTLAGINTTHAGESDESIITNVKVIKSDEWARAVVSAIDYHGEQAGNFTAYTGSLVGASVAKLTLSNIETDIALNGNVDASGLVGYVSAETLMSNVTNGGDIGISGTGGGIIGIALQSAVTLTNITASTFVSVSNYDENASRFSGGVIGEVRGGNVELSNIIMRGATSLSSNLPYNEARVEASGGFVGGVTNGANVNIIKSRLTFESNLVMGDFKYDKNVGGFVGFIGNSRVNISKSYVEDATIINAESVVGGFVGLMQNDAKLDVSDSFVAGDIIAKSTNYFGSSGSIVGGFIGSLNDSEAIFNHTFFVGEIVTVSHNAGAYVGATYNSDLNIDNSLAVALVHASVGVGTFIGSKGETTLTIANAYYNVNFFDADGGEFVGAPSLPINYDGILIALNEINNSFFNTTLGFSSATWLIQGVNFADRIYPQLV